MVDSAGTTRTAAVGGVLALAALILSLGFVLGNIGNARAQTQGGEMTADCEGATEAIEADCDFGDGQEFTLAIHIPAVPADGIWGFQSKLRWNNDILDYRPTTNPIDEAVWPNCSVQARTDNRSGQPSVEVDSSLLYGCVPFPLPEATGPGIDYTGPVFLFTFVCQAAGSSDLTLVPREGDNQLGSHFIDANLSPVDPTLTNASVTCGGAEVDRPDPEIIAGNVAPGPGETAEAPGPTNTPGGPTATPGGPTATITPTTEATPSDTGESDGDDSGLPVWAWVVIGVGAVAVVGGGGFLLWRRMGSGGAPGDGPAGGSTPSAGGGTGSGSDAPSGSAGDG